MAGPQATENRQPAEKKNINKRKKPVREILLAALLAAIVFAVAIVGLQMATGSIDWLPFGHNPSELQKDSAQDLQITVAQLTAPVFIAAGDGSGVYGSLSPDTSLSMKSNGTSTAERMLLAAVKDYLAKGSVAEKITQEQFGEALSAESITAQYSCGLPFEEFLQHNRLKMPSGSTVQYLSRLTLSAQNDGSMYVYDGEKDQYYNIKGNSNDILNGDFVRGLEAAVSENADHQLYAIENSWIGDKDLLPEDPANTETPAASNVPASQDFTPEYSSTDPDKLAGLEALFFPEGMDFIQKVKTSDENLIYMYGSMEKMLRVSKSGGFTFTQETETGSLSGKIGLFSPSPDFYDSLALTVDYIRRHGGWPSEMNPNISVHLISVKKLRNKSDDPFMKNLEGYYFTFALDIAGFPLSYEAGWQLSTVLNGKEIVEYHRDLPDLSKLPGSRSRTGSGTSDPYEKGDLTQNSTSSDSSSEEGSASTAGEKSAFFSDGEPALSLKTVIQSNSVILSDALIEDEMEWQETLLEDEENSLGTETILSRISAADLRLYRMDSAGSSSSSAEDASESSASDSTANGNTERAFPAGNSGSWILAPAWRIRVGNRSLWFHAQSGALIQG